MKLKPTLYKIHKTLGVCFALLLTLQLATGIAISFRWELTDFIYASSLVHTNDKAPLHIGNVIGSFAQSNPGATITRAYFQRKPSSPYLLQVSEKETNWFVAVDPYTGEQIAAGGWWAFPIEAALTLHSQPLFGMLGYFVVVLAGLLLLIMTITGLIYGWPKPHKWRLLAKLTWTSGYNNWGRQLHRLIGFCAAPIALLISITGLLLMAEILLWELGAVSVAPAKSVQEQVAAVREEGIVKVVELAKKAFPDALLRDIRFNHGQWVVQSVSVEAEPWSINRVAVNPLRLSVESVVKGQDQEAWWASILPFHTGTVAGLLGRIVVLMGAIGLLVMAALGLSVWYRKRHH